MVFDRVKEIIVDELSVDEAAVSIESTLEDLGADSLDAVELSKAINNLSLTRRVIKPILLVF